MGVLKNDVGRPSNDVIKKRRILKGIIAILVIIICSLVAYIVNDKMEEYKSNNDNKVVEKENNNSTEVENDNSVKEEKQEEVTIEEASNILYSVFRDFYHFNVEAFNSDIFKTFNAIIKTTPTKTNYTCKELFGEDLNLLEGSTDGKTWNIEVKDDGYSSFLICSDAEEKKSYLYQEVNGTYKKLYGNDKSAIKDHVFHGFVEHYNYSQSRDLYTELSCQCGDGGYDILYGVTKSYKEKDKLYIEFVHSTVEVDEGYSLVLKDETTVEITQKELDDKTSYKKYQDNLDKYKFTFFKEDGVYKYEKVEKID